MSLIIRSSNGERTSSKIMKPDSNPNSNSNNQTPMSIRDEIVEALRGLTFKFEIKISDIFVDENQDEAANSSSVELKPQRGTVDDILPSLISSLPRTAGHEPTSIDFGRVGDNPAPDKETKKKAAPVRERPTCNIRPKTFKVNVEPKTEPVEPKIQPAEPKTVDCQAPRNVKPVASKTYLTSNPLVRGTLKIGSVIKSGCIWLDDENTPYISYDNKRLIAITRMISEMAISIETQPQVNSVDVGDIVFAKSKDDNAWYRALVKRKDKDMNVDVFMFDWGGTETLEINRIRRLTVLELGLSAEPANAMKIKINNPPGPLVDKFLECETAFDIRVESYDDFDEAYAIKILGPSDEKSSE